MIHIYTAKQKFAFILLALVLTSVTTFAQVVTRPHPVWWFGESGAANFNFYEGTTQTLNEGFSTPTAFHKGNDVRPYASLLVEYRPGRVWGGMLNVAFDNRGGSFDQVTAPCNCPANLSTNLSYIAIEPSLRVAPFGNAFYLFAGPTLSFNIAKSYLYTQDKQVDRRGQFSDINTTVFSGQAGAGVDIPLSARTNNTQVTLSPFASFQTNLGHDPRSVESWAVSTVRVGLALKLGTVKKFIAPVPVVVAPLPVPVTIIDKDVQFSVRAPKIGPPDRRVKEIFPLRNSVFFNTGSTSIPERYVQLSNSQAATFKEAQIQQGQPMDLNSGRSARQLSVYYNILNIMGDRMRSNPQSAIILTGSSYKDPGQGKVLAENVKQYLVNVFGIGSTRITTVGKDKPDIPSEKKGGSMDIALAREGDRRVDIESYSPSLLMEVGQGQGTSSFLKPVQMTTAPEDPMDSRVVFNAVGASELLSSWAVQVTDEQRGGVQKYGPYTGDQASVPGKTILGNNTQGNYKVVMTGQTKTGHSIEKESSVSLMKMDDAKQEGMRYSILFDFDRSKSITVYEKFLTDLVAPLIPDNATVIIHGHTDIIGTEAYNLNLSRQRANGAQQILERALSNAGKRGVKFETQGFGEDEGKAPFGNELPEKRFYNRTVIIDIIPAT
ncbi:MAG: OmpA family protein [Taibaiella sp.]|nr:OmpA family protein [Taibaiella sp.]